MVTMSKKILVANWKMNGGIKFAKSFFNDLQSNIEDNLSNNLELAFAVPFPLLSCINNYANFNYKLSAQNCHHQDQGAYTGEVSPYLLKDFAVDYIIIGHSERRAYNHETSALVAKKMQAAINCNIVPIICVGETNSQREAGEYIKIISEQIRDSVIQDCANKEIIIAYEPVWAIGTGKVPSNQEITEIFALIKQQLEQKKNISKVRILYGGSVNKKNCEKLNVIHNLDGYLVGSASLKPSEFAFIAKSLSNSY